MVLKVQPEGIGVSEEGVVWDGAVDHRVVEDLGNHVGKVVEKALHKEKFWLVCKSGSQMRRRVAWKKVCVSSWRLLRRR